MITAFYCYNQTPIKESVESGKLGIISCNLRFAFELGSYTLEYIDRIIELTNQVIFDLISFNFKNIPDHLHNLVIHHKMLLYRIVGCSIGAIPLIGIFWASHLYQNNASFIKKPQEPKEISKPKEYTFERANFECITAPSKLTSIAIKILQKLCLTLFHMINLDPRSGVNSLSEIRVELTKLPSIISEPKMHFVKATETIIERICRIFSSQDEQQKENVKIKLKS